MNDRERARYDAFLRIEQFGLDSAADFPAGSIGKTQFDEISAVIAQINQFSAQSAASAGSAQLGFKTKDTAREDLREDVRDISRTARSMAYQFPGIDLKFRVPVNLNDANLLAVGNAFWQESAGYEADMTAYGLPADFRTDLKADIEAFDQSMSQPGTAIDARVAATAEIGAAIRRGMIARRILDGVVRNKYRSSVGKLAAWTSASHIEKAPKKKTDEPAPPPSPSSAPPSPS